MPYPKIAIGVQLPTSGPLGLNRALLRLARLIRLDSVWVHDHFQAFIPTVLWDEDFSWLAARLPIRPPPFDYQTLLGYLAASAGKMPLGVAVTEPIRRHPVLIAQAALTLAHAARRPPILGIGSGERQNIEPYGLDFSHPAGQLAEALPIIRQCFSSHGPITFAGKYYRLDRAVLDLTPPNGKTPQLWIAAHGPRMLQLTGLYGDGWLPAIVADPDEYRGKLEAIQAAAQEAGRNPHAITPALYQFTLLGPTERDVRAMLETKLGRWLSGLVLASAEEWRKVGAEHPFGQHYRGYVDCVPEQYDRTTLDAAISAVPPELLGYGLLWGTPEQVIGKLRAFGEAGVRHVVLFPWSMMLSWRAAFDGLRAIWTIARRLRSGR